MLHRKLRPRGSTYQTGDSTTHSILCQPKESSCGKKEVKDTMLDLFKPFTHKDCTNEMHLSQLRRLGVNLSMLSKKTS